MEHRIDFESLAEAQAYFNLINPKGRVSSFGVTNGAWSFLSGSTNSQNTGPNAPQKGGYYLYAETTSPTINNEVFFLEYKARPQEFIRSVVFYSHQWGPNFGTVDFEVKKAGGDWKLFKNLDAQTTRTTTLPNWIRNEMTMTETDIVQFRIKLTTPPSGNVYESDLGLDNFTISLLLEEKEVKGVLKDNQGSILPNAEIVVFKNQNGGWQEIDRIQSDEKGEFSYVAYEEDLLSFVKASAFSDKKHHKFLTTQLK